MTVYKRFLVLLPFLIGISCAIGIAAPHFIPRLNRPQQPVVLLYNHIVRQQAKNETFVQAYPNVTVKNFQDQIRYLQDHHIALLTKTQYNEAVTKRTKLLQPSVFLVFRDGYTDIAQNALPILRQYHAPAVVFYDPANMGISGYLTAAQVAQLRRSNISVSTPNPYLLYDPNARQEVSGVINLAQFTDLLPQTEHNSVLSAVFLGLLAICLVAFALLFPRVSLLLPVLALPTYLFRFTVFGIPATLLELILLCVVLGAAARTYSTIAKRYQSFPFWISALLFVAAGCLSTFYAQNRLAALGGLKAYVLEPLLFAVVVYCLTEKPAERVRFLWALIGSTAVIAVLTLLNYIRGISYVTQNLEHTTTYFGNPNYLATFLGVGLVCVLYLWVQTSHRSVRILLSALLLLLAVPFFLAKSDTANLGLFVAVVLLIFYWVRPKVGLPNWLGLLGVCLSILATLGLFLAIVYPKDQMFLQKHKLGTLTSRFYIYQTAERIILQKPITGVGLENFNQAYIANVSTTATEQNVALAHNTLLDFWTQMGLLGIIAYVWVVVRFFRITGMAEPSNPIAQALMAMLLFFVIHGMLDSQYHKNDYSLIFWLCIGLAATLPQLSKSEKLEAHNTV